MKHRRGGGQGGEAERAFYGIAELGDRRGETRARVRALIREADPAVVEEWKWRGVPVRSHDGIVRTGETDRAGVELTLARGAALGDPAGLFDASLEGNTRRAIDIREGEAIDAGAFETGAFEAGAFEALVQAAVSPNAAAKGGRRGRRKGRRA